MLNMFSLGLIILICFSQKTKNPAAATEIRVGIKKRSELTEKLLEEAIKIEQEEGRKQVKTCVEASPFENLNACGAPSPLMGMS